MKITKTLDIIELEDISKLLEDIKTYTKQACITKEYYRRLMLNEPIQEYKERYMRYIHESIEDIINILI